jgi:hypothetical protein
VPRAGHRPGQRGGASPPRPRRRRRSPHVAAARCEHPGAQPGGAAARRLGGTRGGGGGRGTGRVGCGGRRPVVPAAGVPAGRPELDSPIRLRPASAVPPPATFDRLPLDPR